ncbi:MAG: sigma 54-interacting transcriptional regulator [Planctomycetes bacterium]|nr:sigma 54-interacting transcriptional regulator [Planctomycetota bacterium]
MLLALVLAITAQSPAQEPAEPWVHAIGTPVVVDGVLTEWQRRDAITLDRAEQVARDEQSASAWQGPDDASLTLYLAWDDEALYLAGEVKDDHRVHDDRVWWDGDCIELFFDTDLSRQSAQAVWGDDDVQLCLMPYNPGRPWGVAKHGRSFLLSDGGFEGVSVAAQTTRGAGYTFEARIPFANFPNFRRTDKAAGFDVALHDHDAQEGQAPHASYLSPSGRRDLFQTTDHFLPLVFLQGERERKSDDSTSTPLQIGALLIAAVAVLLLVASTARPVFETIDRVLKRDRRRLISIAVGVVGLALVAPYLATVWIEWKAEDTFENRSNAVGRVVSDLASDVAQERGLLQPPVVLDLLRGRSVKPTVAFDWVGFPLRPPESDPRRKTSREGVPVLDYGIPLPAHERLVFPLGKPTPLRQLFVFGTARVDPNALLRRNASDVWEQVLEIGVVLADGTVQAEPFPAVDAALVEPAGVKPNERFRRAWTRDRETAWQYFLGPDRLRDQLVRAVCVTLRERSVSFRLAGITLTRADAGAAPTPLCLLRPSLAGAPAAIVEVGGTLDALAARPGATTPARVHVGRSIDALWLFYSAVDKRVLLPELSGTEVGRVVVQLDGAEPFVRSLRAGVHVGFAVADPEQRGRDMESRVAFRASQSDEHAPYVEALRIDLPQGVLVRDVELQNSGLLDALSLYAVTGGTRVEGEPSERAATLLFAGDEIRLRSADAAEIEGLDFAVLVGDAMAAASFAQQDVTAALKGSRSPFLGAAAGESTVRTQLAGQPYLARAFPIERADGARTAIVAAQRIEGLALARRVQRIAFVAAVLMLAPLAIHLALDWLTRLGRLRLRVTALLVATSLVPTIVLFAVLYRVIADDRARLEESAARSAVAGTRDAIDRMARQVQRAAREVATSDVVERALSADALDREGIARYLREIVGLAPVPGLDLGLRVELEDDRGDREQIHDDERHATSSRFDAPAAGLHEVWGELLVVAVEDVKNDRARARVVAAGALLPAFVEQEGAGTPMRVSLLTLRGATFVGDTAASSEVRAALAAEVLERGEPLYESARDPRLAALDLLRDGGGQPVALIEVRRDGGRMVLDAPFGGLSLETMFLLVALFGLVVAVFMGAVATSRITQPIEALERRARNIARGELSDASEPPVVVDGDEGGEVGRLSNSFRVMTDELGRRAAERDRIERAMAAFTRVIEEDAVAAAVLDHLAEAPRAHAGALYRVDGDGGRVALLRARDPANGAPFARELVRTATIDRLVQDPTPRIATASDSTEWGFAAGGPTEGEPLTLLLPLPYSGRVVAIAVLRYDATVARAQLDAHLPILGHLAGQAAVALENARLYRLAIEDRDTRLYTDSYLLNRFAEEVDRAQRREREVSFVKIEIDGLRRLERERGEEARREAFAQLGRRVKSEARDLMIVAAGERSFLVLLPETGHAEAELFARRIEAALAALKLGTEDAPLTPRAGVATFPTDGESVEFLLEAANKSVGLARRRLRGDPTVAAAPLETRDTTPYVFRSTAMKDVLAQLDKVARSSASVLLLGETGVGKEVVAELLHRWSDRASQPFVALNCAALPEPLLEAELFGYERGAFTGAVKSKPGQLELADGGTVFLDEIGDMPLALQAKLLRVLQERTVVRLGGHTPVSIDIRIVAATHRDLRAMLDAGTFRADLYYRLRVVELVIPPLRDRREDIPALVDQFVRQLHDEHEGMRRTLAPATLDQLSRYPWPGNVRELKNVVQRAMLLADGDVVLPSHLPFEPSRPTSDRPAPAATGPDPQIQVVDADRPALAAGDADLLPRQMQLLAHLRGVAAIRSRDYAELVGVSERTGLRDLQDLVDRGLLVRDGRRKAATYRLTGTRAPLAS